MRKILSYVFSGLDTHSKGASARKLSAFVIVLLVIVTHVKWISLGDFTQLETVLIIDYGFIAGCLGMTTYETITKLRKNEATDKPVDGGTPL